MLRAAYRDYLRAGARPQDAAALAAALDDAGLVESAALLLAYDQGGPGRYELTVGERAGERVYVGPQLPPPEVGAYWFDTCDLALSILVPPDVDPDANYAPGVLERSLANQQWFALAPVARYQFAAFLDAAPIERARPTALDPARIAEGPGTEPVTHLMCAEAWRYAVWFGKWLADEHLWDSARIAFGIAPWHAPAREWVGGGSISGIVTIVCPENAYVDDPAFDDEPYEFDESAILPDVTFRSALRLDLGGFVIDRSTAFDESGARVLGQFPRPALPYP